MTNLNRAEFYTATRLTDPGDLLEHEFDLTVGSTRNPVSRISIINRGPAPVTVKLNSSSNDAIELPNRGDEVQLDMKVSSVFYQPAAAGMIVDILGEGF